MSDIVDELTARILRLAPPSGPAVPVTWFLDIDGVLNVLDRAPHSPGDWPRFIRKAVHDGDWMAWPFCYSPDLVDLINLLVSRKLVQIRWLTTWEHDAYGSAAPQLGLRVGTVLGGIDQGRSETGWWKLRVVQAFSEHGQGPFVWTEDEIRNEVQARIFAGALTRDAGLVVACTPEKGLTPAEFGSIVDYLERRYTSAIRTN